MTPDEAFLKITTEYKNASFDKPAVLVVAGPTASGKTSLAINLARSLDGEIVSCDSMQIYRHMDIGTAKPTKEERSAAVHHLVDFLEPWQDFSVADFCLIAKEHIRDIISRGKVPVLSGGTGLYFSSLIDNIAFSDSDSRESELTSQYEKLAEEAGIDTVFSLLQSKDPEVCEELHKNNVKRVIRSLVLFDLTGLPAKERNILSKSSENEFEFMTYILNPPRDVLYGRIDYRVDKMLEEGLEEEVRHLYEICAKAYENGLSPTPFPGKTASQAIGYKEFDDYFRGTATLSETADKIKMFSRRYAKRQLTWLRRMKNVTWLDIDYD